MLEVKTLNFNKDNLESIASLPYGKNWPVVYLIEDGKEMYIGETTSATTRTKTHLQNPAREHLKRIHLLSDVEFNKSATLDMESWLIEYVAADGKYRLQNGNEGLRNHNYFDREKYRAKFELGWDILKGLAIVRQDLLQLRNSDLFKYSPYKALSEDQVQIVNDLYEKLKLREDRSYLINGKPGTGKTVLAAYLIKFLTEKDETKDLKIGFVVPMTSLRRTIRKVFGNISGLKRSQIIGPSDVVKEKYDLLIVDEAHRLRRRVNITAYGPFDKLNKLFGFGNEGNELDWILRSAKQRIFFYDENQSIRPSDVPRHRFQTLQAETYTLKSQMRVLGGEDYINFIDKLLSLSPVKYKPENYEFKIFDDINEMVSAIRDKDAQYGLARMVAGYAWAWSTRDGKADHDIEIDGLRLTWNSVTEDWVNSKNAINEVGCIHTIQGYDLNYAGVIIGPEINYYPNEKYLFVDPKKYMDVNGKRATTQEELNLYVTNIYKTLLTRGIRGTYVYISDPELRKLFKSSII